MALKPGLKFIGTLGVSLALMAPSFSIDLNPSAMATEVGAAIPLAFVAASLIVPILAICFAVLTRKRGQSGSLYGLVGDEFGPRAGTAAGALLGITYMFVTVVGASAVGVLLSSLWARHGGILPKYGVSGVGIIAIIGALLLVIRPPQLTGRVTVTLEAATIGLILITTFVVLYQLLTTGGPAGQRPTWSVFTLTDSPTGGIALGVVLAFTTFAGFEGAATTGGESRDATRFVPRAILAAAIGAGLFFILVSTVIVWGYGTSAAQVAEIANSDSFVGGVADQYVGNGLGDLITIGATASAFGTVTATTFGASRIFYTMANDGVLPRYFAKTNKSNVPAYAALFVALVGATTLVVWDLLDDNPFDVFDAASTTSGFLFLVAYLTVPVAAARALWKPGFRGAVRALILPTIAFVAVGFTLYKSIWPLPTGAVAITPWLALIVIVAALALMVLRGSHAKVHPAV